MTSILAIEQAAQRLRRNIRVASRPDLRILCALEFFRLFADEHGALIPQHAVLLETYLREFIPGLAADARQCDPREFFPDEVERLGTLVAWLERAPEGTVAAADLMALERLCKAVTGPEQGTLTPALFLQGRGGKSADMAPSLQAGRDGVGVARPEPDHSVILNGLLVEENPDLGLQPRGRLLELRVTATLISGKVRDDDIVIRNPTARPDDPFRQQAQIAVAAARRHLAKRYGLSDKKHYRFDFEVLSAATALTGPSLGLAFAVGAIAALAQTEVLRDRLAMPPTVAFSGALDVDGRLIPVDGMGLRRKIERAFHSQVAFLVIPRDHLSDAWEQVAGLEAQHPGRKLDLVGADTLDAVTNDPRLLVPRRSSLPMHIARKAWKTKRSAWVEVPVLVMLVALLLGLVAPAKWMPWFDRNPAFAHFNLVANSLDVFNRDSALVWADTFACKLIGENGDLHKVHDLDGDGKSEVLSTPWINETDADRGWLRCHSYDGKPRFRRYCAIEGQYPGDTAGAMYDFEHITVVENHGEPLIITEVGQSNPGRSHIRLWSGKGDSLGWYINAGGSRFVGAKDLNRDGGQELLFVNFNNRTNCAALLVLAADSSYGCSPPYVDPVWDLSQVKLGNQLAYLLFPVSDLGRIDLPNEYNQPSYTGVRDNELGCLDVYIGESRQGYADIVYHVSRALRVQSASFTDQFRKRRDQLVSERKLPPVDWAEYAACVRDSVRYWTGSGWVSEGQLRAAESGRRTAR